MESLDILYITLSVCIALISVFLAFTLLYLLFILRDVVKISAQVKDIVDKVDRVITQPIMMTKKIVEFVSPFIQTAQGHLKKARPRKGRE